MFILDTYTLDSTDSSSSSDRSMLMRCVNALTYEMCGVYCLGLRAEIKVDSCLSQLVLFVMVGK